MSRPRIPAFIEITAWHKPRSRRVDRSAYSETKSAGGGDPLGRCAGSILASPWASNARVDYGDAGPVRFPLGSQAQTAASTPPLRVTIATTVEFVWSIAATGVGRDASRSRSKTRSE